MLNSTTVQSSVESVYTEEQMKESREEFQTLFNLMPDPVVIVDGKGKFLAVNDKVEEMTNFSKQELLGKNFLRTRIVTTKSKAILIKNLAKRMIGMNIEPYEVEVVSKNGQKIIVEVNARKIQYEGKQADLVIFRDITKRKKADEALRESEEKFRNLAEQSPNMIFINQNGRVVYANTKCEEIMGYKREEFYSPDFSFLTLIAPESVDLVKLNFNRHMKDEDVAPYEYRLITKEGKKIEAIITPKLIRYNGESAILGIITDITERKKAEQAIRNYSEHLEELVEERTTEVKKVQEQLLKAERAVAVGELATMVGHDLRNPLQSIKNATYYLNKELSRSYPSVAISQKTMEMLQIINDSVNYADKIIRDLKDFSLTIKPILKKVDINMIVKDALSQVEAPESVKLITELRHLPKIKVDQDMMRRTFLNLALNAIQAMESGGTLKVSTKETERFVEVSFKDTGMGISKENIEKIFTPFFTTKAKGMGMGLSICKKLVESHGGSIRVESKQGKGSTFTVILHILQENGGENR